MANYVTLKSAIQQVVKTNGNNEITGALLQQSLLAMINSLGAGYQFIDVATTATKPGTPDQKVFYIANGKGTYTNFGGISITEDEVVILYYDTAWHKLLTGIASQAKLSELDRKITNVVGGTLNLDLNFVVGSYYDTRGNVVQNVGSKATGKINIKNATELTITGSFGSTSSRSTIFYDENENIVEHIEESAIISGQAIDVRGYSYVAFSCLNTSTMNASVEISSELDESKEKVNALYESYKPLIDTTQTSDTVTTFKFELMTVDIKNGERFAIRINANTFSRIIICYNGANANRLLDTMDTSLANTWIDVVAPTDIVSLGIGYLTPSVSVSLSYKTIGKITELDEAVKGGNVLNGKKWVACGDSFTHGDYSNSPVNDYTLRTGKYAGQLKVYPFLIGNRNNMEIVNEAVNGSSMAYKDGTRFEFSLPNGRYTKIPTDADYITLKFGINDDSNHLNIPIGTIDDATNATFYGAWNIVMDYIITHHPQAKIGIIITNGSTLPYVEATIAIAKKWGISYLNEATDEQCSFMFRSLRTNVKQSVRTFRDNQWFVDAQLNNHPNAKAHEYESYVVENWLRSL